MGVSVIPIPIGTQATVKALSPEDLKKIGVQVVLANTYHLMLRPGSELIKKMGGLHQFMGWDGPIMTDSGGFQVFSLGVALEQNVGKLLREQNHPGLDLNLQTWIVGSKPRLNKITEEGVIFQSHLDGSKHILTPEKSNQIQKDLGADLTVAFDDLESPKYSYGGVFKDLRIRSAKFVDKYFAGIALGGAHRDKKTLYQVVEWTVSAVNQDKPRHMLGIGEMEDLFECIARGIDLFDCAAPTRRARNGSFTISLAKYSQDKKPIDSTCLCDTCQNFSRAYIRHLFMAKELLYHQLASIHNIFFIENLMGEMREKIKQGDFKNFKKSWLGKR